MAELDLDNKPLPSQIEALLAQRLAPDTDCSASDVRALVADVLTLATTAGAQPLTPSEVAALDLRRELHEAGTDSRQRIATAAMASPDTARMDLLSQFGIETGHDDDEDAPFVVYRVRGGRNDREWTALGRGETMRAAVDAALQELAATALREQGTVPDKTTASDTPDYHQQTASFSTHSLALKPMATAPRPVGDEHFRLLVLEERNEGGQLVRDWKLVYWVDAWDGMPAGWCASGHGDFRNPLGWVLSTAELEVAAAPAVQPPNQPPARPAPSWADVRHTFALFLSGATGKPSRAWEPVLDETATTGVLAALRTALDGTQAPGISATPPGGQHRGQCTADLAGNCLACGFEAARTGAQSSTASMASAAAPVSTAQPALATLHEMAYILRLVPQGEIVPIQILMVLREQYRAAMLAAAATAGQATAQPAQLLTGEQLGELVMLVSAEVATAQIRREQPRERELQALLDVLQRMPAATPALG